MNSKHTPKTIKTITARLQDYLRTAQQAAATRATPYSRLTTLPAGDAFNWTPILIRPRSKASRWIE